MFKSSHRPDGKMADMLALTHACTTANASVNYRTCVLLRPSNVPIAPMGSLLTCYLDSRLHNCDRRFGHLQGVRAAETLKVPIASCDTHVLLVVCREVLVSMSRVAQWPSHRAPSVGTQLPLCALISKSSHHPDGNIADALDSVLGCTTATDASFNYRGCALQRP